MLWLNLGGGLCLLLLLMLGYLTARFVLRTDLLTSCLGLCWLGYVACLGVLVCG